MCSPASCRQCGKTTWSGCGMHVNQVMSRVPADRRCSCEAAQSGKREGRRRRFFRW